jgi:hypothetical protein
MLALAIVKHNLFRSYEVSSTPGCYVGFRAVS